MDAHANLSVPGRTIFFTKTASSGRRFLDRTPEIWPMQKRRFASLLLLAALLSPLPSFSEEMLTSVTQVSDVNQKDACFEALQSLIERWGMTDLTVNKQFRPTHPVTPNEVSALVSQARSQMTNLCKSVQIPARLVPELQTKLAACPSPASETAVIQYLRSTLGSKLAQVQTQSLPLTRGVFINHLNTAIDESYYKLNELASDTAILNDLRQRVKVLTPAQSSKALQLCAEIESGVGDYGTPTQQKTIASSPGFVDIKSEVYLRSGQAAKADSMFQAEFDVAIQQAQKHIEKFKEIRYSQTKLADREKSKAQLLIAAAKATNSRRHRLYALVGKPINPPNLPNSEKLAELEALLK